MKLSFSFRLSLASVLLVSCAGSTPEKTVDTTTIEAPQPVEYDNSLEKGKVIPAVACAEDASQSYALYLPAGYTSSRSWPVIFFFDPHASGIEPLGRYYSLAEKYGYVIVCSNNSKNGNPWETTQQIADLYFKDVKKRLNTDARRIYTAGFSGGAKVASSLANFNGGIAGVIGCGGAFPYSQDAIKNSFDFIGLAGYGDFNYTELRQLNGALDFTQIRHQFVPFEGKHEWPPLESMEQAFVWTELNAMRDKLIPVRKEFVEEHLAAAEKELEQAKSDIMAEFIALSRLVSSFDGLADVEKYKKRWLDLRNSEELLTLRKEVVKKFNQEQSTEEKYAHAMKEKDLDWWRAESKRFREIIANGTSKEDKAANDRIMGYLSLAAYMNTTNFLKKGVLDKTEKCVTIYKLVDPTNAEAPYLAGCLYAQKKEQDRAVSELKDAVKLGFKDATRMETDSMLLPLKGNLQFEELIKGLKK